MKQCSYCQAVANSDTQKFCSKCGRPFPPVPVAETPPAPAPKGGAAAAPKPPEPPKEPAAPPLQTQQTAANLPPVSPRAPAANARKAPAPPPRVTLKKNAAPGRGPAGQYAAPPAAAPVRGAAAPVPPQPKKKKKGFGVLVAVLVLAILLLTGAIVYILGSRAGLFDDFLSGFPSSFIESFQRGGDADGQEKDRTDEDDRSDDADTDADGGNDADGDTGDDLDTGDADAEPEPTPEPTPAAPAVATETTVVIHDAHPNGRLLVDGQEVPFEYVGSDIVIQRSVLPDVCQVRLIAENGGAYQTAAVWFNEDYGHELSFAADYGDYETCDVTGLAHPSEKVINVLIWAYHLGFLQSINEQSTSYMRYSTQSNTKAEEDHIFSTANSQNKYKLDDFSATLEPDSVQYNGDGTVLFNASFRSEATNRSSGKKSTVNNHKTMEIIWEDGMWKVNRIAFLNDDDFDAGRYADFS